MKNILVVDDDKALRTNLVDFLSGEGYAVKGVGCLAEAKEALAQQPSLLILDWQLPDGQGIDFLRSIRAAGNSVPVLMLSGKSEVIDKILGLETGANDYCTKPCEPREIAARVRVQFREKGAEVSKEGENLEVAGIEMDCRTRAVRYDGREILLRKMEFELLKMLMENPNKVFSRDEILNQVWGFECYPTTRTIDTHILSLRHKLNPDIFETIRGVGYRLVRPEEYAAVG